MDECGSRPEADYSTAEARYSEELKDPNLRMIRLTNGQITIVDASCYERLTNWKWRANWSLGAKAYYALRAAGKRKIYMHCEIMGLYQSGPLSKKRDFVVDHKNGDPCDNRHCNLQIISRSKDALKRRTPRKSTTGFRCICRRERANGYVYTAYIRINGVKEHLGTFKNLKLAVAARVRAVRATRDPHQREYGLTSALLVTALLCMAQRVLEVLPEMMALLHHG